MGGTYHIFKNNTMLLKQETQDSFTYLYIYKLLTLKNSVRSLIFCLSVCLYDKELKSIYS
jgi:hypothetical protein